MWTGPLLLSLVAAASSGPVAQPASTDVCATWQACRDVVETALTAESFEPALDAAWRAVRLGPRDDAALMFLLARAQARAGRPQDALVMVRRLAERGIATEAITHPDLERTRELAGWAEVGELVARANAGELPTPPPPAAVPVARASRPSPPAPVSAPPAPVIPTISAKAPASTAPPGPPTADAVPIPTAVVTEEQLRFAADPFVPAGFAYDAVSRRFVVGDERGRKLRVAGEGLDHAVDLVRAESAGFLDVRALAIDGRRGDLWVASSDDDGRQSFAHRIQLISGRPLQAITLAGDAGGAFVPVDLAVSDAGTVWLLTRDGALARIRTGAAAAEIVARLDLGSPALSVALAPGEAVAYVAHQEGLVRVELRKGAATQVGSTPALPLKGFERLRAYRGGFVALQQGPDADRRLLRLELNRTGRSVRAATTYDVQVPAGQRVPALAVSGDEVFLVTGTEARGNALSSTSDPGSPAGLVVRRLRLP